jgi:hypothetical protein
LLGGGVGLSSPPPGFCPAHPNKSGEFSFSEATIFPVNRYERRLPHWDAVGCSMFVTFRLAGSLPKSRAFPPARCSSGQAFVTMDRLLDRATEGPVFLRQHEIAQIVIDAIRDGEAPFIVTNCTPSS